MGTVLGGRYALISPLGRGGMGQVWEGRDEWLGRRVAVKLLVGQSAGGPPRSGDPVRRFTREAAVTAGLAHPGVPAIFDAGTYDDGLFLVMELVDGCTVGDLVAEQGALPVAWAAGIAAQVSAVLVLAHERGIVHRDIKPQNVMVTRDGTVKVLDFGVAGIRDQRITSTGATVGTPAYMAPEQLHGLPATPRTDLYTLGCLLYEMLSGEPVFAANTPAGLMHQHLAAAPAPLRRSDIHPWLGTLVWQLLEKDPEQRPPDARQVYERLLPWVQAPGPLGDINPAAGSRSSGQLYATLVSRLQGASPAATLPPATWAAASAGTAAPAVTRPASRRWMLGHSLWLLPTLVFGLFNWLSFGYIGIRHRNWWWLGAAVAYLAADIASGALIGAGPESGSGPGSGLTGAGVIILLAVWVGGMAHACYVNFAVRLPLLASRPAGRQSPRSRP